MNGEGIGKIERSIPTEIVL